LKSAVFAAGRLGACSTGRTPLECAHEDPHWTLVMEADLSFPIIVTREPWGLRGLRVVDGRHRIVKAWLLGFASIQVRVVDHEALRALVVEDGVQYVLNGTA